jgi:copper chaperone CopZ
VEITPHFAEKKMKTELSIDGMSCQHCVQSVTKALKGIGGVTSVAVNLEEKRAILESEGDVDRNAIEEILQSAGFRLEGVKTA